MHPRIAPKSSHNSIRLYKGRSHDASECLSDPGHFGGRGFLFRFLGVFE